MGLSSEAGRLLAQQFEQHQIQKRYHAIVRGWLMEEAVLDYPLVEELDKIADKFAREDKGSQPAVTHYRGLATVEMLSDRTLPDHALRPGGTGAENRTQTSASPTSCPFASSDYWR